MCSSKSKEMNFCLGSFIKSIKSGSGRWKLLVLLCLILCVVFTSIGVSKKERFHVDEIWSYSLSNSTDMPFFYWHVKGIGPPGGVSRHEGYDPYKSVEFYDYFDHWHDGSFYHKYITVQNDERFDYGTVFYNQVCDIHPPLYYCILHTICSFTPDVFSKWQGLVPNIIFYTVTLIFLYFFAMELTGSKKTALLSMVFWGFSGGAVSCTSFIRMYCLLTMLSVMAAYFYIRFYKTLKTRYVVGISLTVLAGLLTQYMFYLFAFFLTLIFCIYLLFKKKFKEFFGLGLSVLASVAAAFAIFPATVLHMFNGAYTDFQMSDNQRLFPYGIDKSLNKLLRSIAASYFYNFSDMMINSVKLIIIGICFIFLVVFFLKMKGKKNFSFPEKYLPFTLLMAALILTSIFVGKNAAEMKFCAERYYFFILPYFSVLICSLLIVLIRKAFSKKVNKLNVNRLSYAVTTGLCAFFVCMSNCGIIYSYILPEAMPELRSELKGKPCFIITENHIIHAFSPDFQETSKVYSVCDTNGSGTNYMGMSEQLSKINESYVIIMFNDFGQNYGKKQTEKIIHDQFEMPANHKVDYLGRIQYTIEDYMYDVFRVTVR